MEKSKSGSAVRSGPGRQMLRRCVVLAAVFGIGVFAVLLARLYQLQIKEHEFYEELAIEQQLRSTPGLRVARRDIRREHERAGRQRDGG